MSVILSKLEFNITDLVEGENNVIMTYYGASTQNDIQLVLMVQNEKRVKLKDEDGKFKSSILIPNQLTDNSSSYKQTITVNVSETTSPKTPVFLKLYVQGTSEQELGSMYF